ncbi:MAG: NUDIX domain-containing protein [Nitrospira sp.]|nr:NUDIX domain-containing protein [Nitrospira sp.]
MGAPSGIVDPRELPSDAAVREVWEEAGVYVELTQVLGVFAGNGFPWSIRTAISWQGGRPSLRGG